MNKISKFEIEGAESNNNAKVNEDNQTYSKCVSGASDNENEVKILGVGWDNKADVLHIDLAEITVFAKALPPTMRLVFRC